MIGIESLPAAVLAEMEFNKAAVLGFYDLTCPFCYVAQGKSTLLERLGLTVVELPFQAHPEIPSDGLQVGERTGPMYAGIAAAALDAGLPLKWQPRLPNSRLALAAAEWVRCYDYGHAASYRRSLFSAHFAEEESIDDVAVLTGRAAAIGVDPGTLQVALEDGSALHSVTTSERLGRARGVTGTPTWLADHTALVGGGATTGARWSRLTSAVSIG